MTMPADCETDAVRLRETMAKTLAEDGVLADPAWRAAIEAVPRHRFVPGFYLPADERDGQGLTVWEPVTAELDYGRWLAAAYTDTTLITQFDGDETDWKQPTVRHGGAPTSSSTLPSLVLRMWADADLHEGHTVLEIGTGTGYSTALACERLGSADMLLHGWTLPSPSAAHGGPSATVQYVEWHPDLVTRNTFTVVDQLRVRSRSGELSILDVVLGVEEHPCQIVR